MELRWAAFGLVFAFARGRIGITCPRALASLLAAWFLRCDCPGSHTQNIRRIHSVGNPDTIGIRTATFFLLMAFSIAAMILAVQIGRYLSNRYGAWNGSLLVAGLFVVLVNVAFHFLPVIDEVPDVFPATLMWHFRIASLEILGWDVDDTRALVWMAHGARSKADATQQLEILQQGQPPGGKMTSGIDSASSALMDAQNFNIVQHRAH